MRRLINLSEVFSQLIDLLDMRLQVLLVVTLCMIMSAFRLGRNLHSALFGYCAGVILLLLDTGVLRFDIHKCVFHQLTVGLDHRDRGNVAVVLQTCTCRNQRTDNDVLLQTGQRISLALDCSIRQDACSLLERGGGQESICCQRSLGNTQQDSVAGSFYDIVRFSLLVGFIELEHVD